MNPGMIDRLLDRLDRLEPEEIQRLVLKIVQEKGFLEKVFEVLREGVVVTGAKGSIHYINQAACDFFGLDPKEAIRGDVATLFPGLDWEEITATGGVVNRDLVVRYPEPRFLNFYVAPLADRDSGEDLVGHVIILRDQTRTVARQRQEVESGKLEAVTSLAAGVAHEIGNPLNSLNIHLQVVERKIKKRVDPELAGELLESLEIARGEIKRLDFIVEKFLNAVRPVRPVPQTTDLNQLIEEAMNFIGPEVADRRIAVTLDLAEGLPLLHVDQDQLKQVLYNLVRNSCQAMGSDGGITVRTGSDDENVFFTIADNGPGIPADQVSRVFEPYYTTKKTGSGLGLLIVHRIVHDHGGEVEFKSREGIGTEVTVYLPRAEKLMRFLPSKAESAVIDVEVEG
ncbi:MAG: PAS domain-containing protein [Verrucomicrobiales bacterium]|nr:PAS domain-containing protein [Verrucomicrobiales bacterium]